MHIIEDGIPTGDLSSTSDHHGVTIDPSSAEWIEITRGPATLLYGSNIIGLINVITPHAAYRNLLTPPESYGDTLLDGTRGRLGTDATSASRQVGTYANVQHSRGHLLYWGSGAYRQAGDYATPEGSVFNSATELSNARAGLGYFGDRFFTSLSLTKEDSRFGLPYEDRFHAHGDGDEHDHEDDGEEHDEVGEEHVPMPPDPRNRHFLAASGSVGLHADLGSGSAIVANLTHSHRVPALEELYNFGPHLGNFEIGRTDLAAETMRSFEVSFRQRLGRVQGETNFYSETGTRGYSVVNMEASYVWPRQHFAHVLSFTGYNLTNALYRNHTSFIKDLAPEMGRGVRVGYSLRFF